MPLWYTLSNPSIITDSITVAHRGPTTQTFDMDVMLSFDMTDISVWLWRRLRSDGWPAENTDADAALMSAWCLSSRTKENHYNPHCPLEKVKKRTSWLSWEHLTVSNIDTFFGWAIMQHCRWNPPRTVMWHQPSVQLQLWVLKVSCKRNGGHFPDLQNVCIL